MTMKFTGEVIKINPPQKHKHDGEAEAKRLLDSIRSYDRMLKEHREKKEAEAETVK